MPANHRIPNPRKVAVITFVFVLAIASFPLIQSATSVAAVSGSPVAQIGYPNFADIVANVQPTVVNISTNPPRSRFGGLRQSPSDTVGSGFIIGPEGHIVTNYHVVDRAEGITVTLNDGTQLTAVLVGGDDKTDLALLKVETTKPLPHAEFGDSARIRAGDWVVAIGNPFGLGGSVTAGIVSALGRDIRTGPYDDYLQIDAPINRGNSGGPLFDLSGRVIGVNTAILSPHGGSIGIGFAIPVELARPIIDDLMEDGRVERGWLGVQIQSVTPLIAESLGLEEPAGVLVADVVPASPAAEAGITVGDVILAVDGNSVSGAKALTHAVAAFKPDTSVTMAVWRHGRQDSLIVKIGEKSSQTPLVTEASGSPTPSKPRLGVSLAPITPHLRSQFGIPAHVHGVIVVGIENASPAAEGALKEGDVIVRIGDIVVKTPGDVSRGVEVAAQSERDTVLLLVARSRGSFFVAVPFG